MINSRSLDDLHPTVRALAFAFKGKCAEAGIDLLVTCTHRDDECQAALYAQGRSAPGPKVTNAKPGFSWHNWRCALDVVPLRHGKPVWGIQAPEDRALWMQVGEIGESVGLEWAWRWESFPELAHFQYTGGLTMAEMRAGKTLDEAVA